MTAKARNAAAMKAGNMLEIIRMLLKEPLTRAEIARRTGLTRAAVTIITERLTGDGVLRETSVSSGAGKTPVRQLVLCPRRFLFLGVDIRRDGYTAGLTDLGGATLDRRTAALVPGQTFEQLIGSVKSDLIRLTHPLVTGIGVGVPGPVEPETGLVLNPPNFGLIWNQDLRLALQGDLPAGLWIENNALARTVYEKYAGLGQALSAFMVVIVDRGIGSGLYLNGQLYRGAGFAGELGHLSIDRRGPLCACGSRGCLENYAAVPMLLGRCRARTGAVVATWADLVDRAYQDDSGCLEALRDEADCLAQGLVSVLNLLDLEAVILTGDLTYQPDLLLGEIRSRVQQARMARQAHDVRIEAAKPRSDAGMASAALVAIDRFFRGQADWPLA